MYLPESYVYKGIKIKSHRAATRFSLEKYKSLRNSSGLGKAVTFSYHGNAHLPPFYAGPTLEPASCRLEDSAVGQKDPGGELEGLWSGPNSDANQLLKLMLTASETRV